MQRESDMARSLNGALTQAVLATAVAERERDKLGETLAAEQDKTASLQALLMHAAASRLQAEARRKERTNALQAQVVSLQEQLETQRKQTRELDEEVWRYAERQVEASSRLGLLQQEASGASAIAQVAGRSLVPTPLPCLTIHHPKSTWALRDFPCKGQSHLRESGVGPCRARTCCGTPAVGNCALLSCGGSWSRLVFEKTHRAPIGNHPCRPPGAA